MALLIENTTQRLSELPTFDEPLVERPSSAAAAGGAATVESVGENPAAMPYDSDDDEWVL